LLHALDDLLMSEMSAVQEYGVCRGHHRCEVAGPVAAIPFLLCPEHLFPRKLFAALGHLLVPAAGTLGGIGNQEELA
jgi:hypothetical protein